MTPLEVLAFGAGCYAAGIVTVAGGAYAWVRRTRARAAKAAATIPFDFTVFRLDED